MGSLVAVGIDPGNEGAIVALNRERRILCAEIMPTVNIAKKGAKARRIIMDVVGVHGIFCRLLDDPFGVKIRDALVAIEYQQSFPGQGISSTGKLMRAFGQLEGLIVGRRVRYELPRPAQWQTVMKGVEGEGKQRAVLFAQRELPQLDLTPGRRKKPHEGLADAAAISLWALSKIC